MSTANESLFSHICDNCRNQKDLKICDDFKEFTKETVRDFGKTSYVHRSCVTIETFF